MTVTIRDAVSSDAAAIADIYNQAVLHTTATFDTETGSAEERTAWLAAHGRRHPIIVAEQDGRVVGWASLSRWSDRPAYDRTAEYSTYVDERAQRGGVGTLLTVAILERAREAGVHAVIGRVCAENEASLKIASRLGFEEVGVMREVGLKFGRLLDVVVVQKLLV